MKVVLVSISGRGGGGGGAVEVLVNDYVSRILPYISTETKVFRSEQAFLEGVSRLAGRTSPQLVLLHAHGKRLSSEEFAIWIGERRDGGAQTLVFAVGPADGWSAAALARAGLVLSLGSMTLPHQLARVVLAEQVYRAFTILANHPYHGGH